MAFCAKCGAQMNQGAAFCPACGNAVATTASGAAAAPAPAAASTGMTNNVAGMLCYLVGWITGLIFLLIEPYKNDKVVRFHAFQSIFFSAAWIALYIALGILESLLPWTLLRLVAILSIFVSLAFFCVALWLMYRAYNKERFKLPILGDLAEKLV